ncbi:hypothetical protein FDP41_002983 [Naegleria fowleri]|uniref:RCC1-like domain-containing protein n=1 Tax=Naegleria fowleri TaxID=5763 RepID=A0A6A5BTH0_NAEFO|nr:uncharacterized protein FDP41_002983 [Naegleria fowleri]KAF0977661.1 hypothetical protein FDP41_002983 [Naegleria fowleri]
MQPLVKLFGQAIKFNSLASTESSSRQDDAVPPQHLRAARANKTNSITSTAITTHSVLNSVGSVGSSSNNNNSTHHHQQQQQTTPTTNTSCSSSTSRSHNSSPSSSPKHEDDDAFNTMTPGTNSGSASLDGLDYLLLGHHSPGRGGVVHTPSSSTHPLQYSTTVGSTAVVGATTTIHSSWNNPHSHLATSANMHPYDLQQQQHFLNIPSYNNPRFSTESSTGSKGLSTTPVDAHHPKKHLPSGSLIRPYHHYKIFYCGDNRYNLLHDIAVDQFVLSKSTRLYKIGKSAPIDRLSLSNSKITSTRRSSNSAHNPSQHHHHQQQQQPKNIQQQQHSFNNFHHHHPLQVTSSAATTDMFTTSADHHHDGMMVDGNTDASFLLKPPAISLSLADDDSSMLLSTMEQQSLPTEDFMDIQQASSFSISSSLLNIAPMPTSIGQQLLYSLSTTANNLPPSNLCNNGQNHAPSINDHPDCHMKDDDNYHMLYNTNDERDLFQHHHRQQQQHLDPSFIMYHNPQPYFKSSVDSVTYLSPFLNNPTMDNPISNNLSTDIATNGVYLTKMSSNHSSSSEKNPFGSHSSNGTSSSSNKSGSRSSIFGSSSSFAEGIETTVIHPIDIHRFLSSSSSVMTAATTKTNSGHMFANNFSYITEEIIFVAAGFDSTFFLSQSGRIWSCGENACHQLGHPGNDLDEIRDAQFLNIKEIFSRGEHTLFLANDNMTLYSCGSNRYGQCGVGTFDPEIRSLARVKNNNFGTVQQILQVVCGYDHTVVLSADHNVYMCGDNTDFQLGNSFPQHVNTLTKLDTTKFTKSRIVKVQAGDYHTIALTASGEVFVTGSNNYGEIGSTGTKECFTLLTELYKSFGNITITDIFSNSLTSYLRDSNGNFYVMGDNQYGHAAVGFAKDVIPPMRSTILSDPDVLDIYVGKCHLVYTKRSKKSPQDVEVFSLGLNEFNQLGIESAGADDHHITPVRLLDLETIYQYQQKRWRTKRMNIVCSTYATIVYFTQRNEQETTELFRLLMLCLIQPDKWFKAVEGKKKLEMGFDLLGIEGGNVNNFADISMLCVED